MDEKNDQIAKFLAVRGNYGDRKPSLFNAFEIFDHTTSTDPDFEIAEEKIRLEIDKATNHIKKLKARRDSLPARVTVADAQKGQEMVKLSTERKHLTNVLKMSHTRRRAIWLS